jgi:GntR family transcriptional regulator, transcriptional repressor for pyruvate dehydrogenase complex
MPVSIGAYLAKRFPFSVRSMDIIFNMEYSDGRQALEGRVLTLSNRRPLKRSEVIARDLAQYIVDARLPAGSMLPREREMIDQLGVGRTTLREALRILETRGVLTIRSGPGGGPVVRHPEPNDLTEALTLILQFQRATMLEVHDARIWLEPTAARMAATHITKAEIKRLRDINAEMKTAIDSSEENIMDANRRFHGVIAAATANLVVQVFLETLLTVVDSGVQDINHSREFKRIAAKGHDEIIDALEAKDPDRAEDAMRRHLVEGKKRRFKENRDLMSRPLRWVQ